jgi:predicted tellurium resistance membrane protein TerC
MLFLVLISVLLIVEDVHIEKIEIPKGYIYFAMAFSFDVELLNLKMRKKMQSNRAEKKRIKRGLN